MKLGLPRRVVVWVLAVAAAWVWCADAAWAHPGLATTATLRVKADGGLALTCRHDVLAFALNDTSQRVADEDMLGLMNGPRADLERTLAEGRARFALLCQVTADGVPVALTITHTPTAEKVLAWRDSGPLQLLPVKDEFVATGAIPAGARVVRVKFPEVLGDVVMTVQMPGAEPLGTPVRAGTWSEELGVGGASPTAAQVAAQSGGEPVAREPGARARVARWFGFVWMGFEHILPMGVDHILFVLGLFFLSPKVKPLLVQITAFTVAHSVTLALSARGVIQLPGSVVEPVIAASIAFVAIENICTQKVHWWRTLVVFAFGLIHGMGFAAAFAEAFGSERIPIGPVVLFNVGVELGQLAVVGIALLAVGWFREKKWYRAWIAIPCSVVIAAFGVWWTVERVFL